MKRDLRKIAGIGLLALLLPILFPGSALAYLDPGTGSYIFQVILAAVLGALFSLKVFWKKIRAFFGNLFSGKDADDKSE